MGYNVQVKNTVRPENWKEIEDMYRVQVPRCWQGELQGLLWWVATAALCWTQPFPSQLQCPHPMAWHGPVAKVVVPWRKRILKRVKCCLAVRGEKKCERNYPEGRAEGGGGTKCPSRHSPAAPGEDHSGAGLSLQSMERTVLEQISSLQCPEDPVPQHMDVSWRNCDPWRAHTGTGVS